MRLTVQIMCLNGWGGALFEAVQAYLQQVRPDVLCLQEVVHSPASNKPWLTYRDGDHKLPQRANFFRDVCEVLPDHAAYFFPAAQGVLWDEDKAIPSQWGLATFVRSDLPIIGKAQGFVHKNFSAHGYGDHPRSRNAHVFKLYDIERDKPIVIAHMHGLRDLAGKMDTPERLAQAERFVHLIQKVADADDPLVVCGDFNIEPSSRMFEVFARIGLRDLVTGRGFTDTRTSHYRKSGRYADYMLVNDRVDVLGFDVVEQPEVSDHRPLLLTL